MHSHMYEETTIEKHEVLFPEFSIPKANKK